ncbi:MAG: phage holin family protein [Candidatus Dormibacteria bacterium]
MSQATDHKPDTGLGAIGKEVADDAVRLVRAEIELAKAQMKQAALRLAVGIGFVLTALILLVIGTIEALSGLPAAFSVPLFGNTWLGWVAFGGVFLVLAGVLGFVGTRLLRRSFSKGKQTVDAFKEDAEWLKGLTKRGSSES